MPKPYSKSALELRDIRHLAYRLGMQSAELVQLAVQAGTMYRYTYKTKSSGKLRKISAPKWTLKRVQKKINNLLLELQICDNAHCGIKEKSNITNARNHLNQKWVFSLDFENFFPNVSNYMVYRTFNKGLACSPEVARTLTLLCTVDGGLPQGAPTSTTISNLICGELDKRLVALNNGYNLNYSRYCDNLDFSGKCIPDSFKTKVKKIISNIGFKLNNDKESLRGQGEPQVVTGLGVNQKKTRVPRATKREWRKEMHEAKNLDEDVRQKTESRYKSRVGYIKNVES